eukprot:1159958-Pelagomonas_calceolata.AAC.20
MNCVTVVGCHVRKGMPPGYFAGKNDHPKHWHDELWHQEVGAQGHSDSAVDSHSENMRVSRISKRTRQEGRLPVSLQSIPKCGFFSSSCLFFTAVTLSASTYTKMTREKTLRHIHTFGLQPHVFD